MAERFSNDDLQAIWDDQPAHLTIPNMKELTMVLQEQHRQEQRRLLFLNLQEVTPAVGLSLLFGWKGLQTTTNAWAFFGAALLGLGVGAFLVGTSIRQRRLERGHENTTRGELERSRSQMQHRARLYRTVAWWYLLPIAGAIILSMVAIGMDFTAPATLAYLATGVGGGVVLYRVNRKIGREKYEPKVKRLSQLIADMG